MARLLAFCLFIACTILLGFSIERDEFLLLVSVYFVFIGTAVYIYKQSKTANQINQAVALGFVSRIILIFCLPWLSDDFYRYIWDGILINSGINPFDYLPSELTNDSGVVLDEAQRSSLKELYPMLNSQNYYTVYPAFNQIVFFVSTVFNSLIFEHSIWIMKGLFLIAEIGSVLFIKKLLKHLKFRANKILLYGINPILIVELIGNLHFETFMIFFILGCWYYLLINKFTQAGLLFSLAVNTKLLPLLVLPYLILKLKGRGLLIFIASFSLTTVILNLYFWNDTFLPNYLSSIRLYFEHFAFNGSVFYLLRGFIDFAILGKVLSGISVIIILIVSYKFKDKPLAFFPIVFISVWTVYYLFSTTIHPWYLTPLLALCLFTNFRFPLIWSVLIILTYVTYISEPYRENTLIIVVEYVILYLLIFYEMWMNKGKLDELDFISE